MSPHGQERLATSGSQLCQACGLCCQGLLHDWAILQDHEVEAARGLGLRPEKQGERAVFSLPCPLHLHGSCSVYNERPSPCRDYRCKLLRGFEAGQTTWEDGLRRIQQAKHLVAILRSRIGAPDQGSVWAQVREVETTTLGGTDVQMDIAALLTHCQRHFWDRPLAARSVAV